MALEPWTKQAPLVRVVSPLKTFKSPKLETIIEEKEEELDNDEHREFCVNDRDCRTFHQVGHFLVLVGLLYTLGERLLNSATARDQPQLS